MIEYTPGFLAVLAAIALSLGMWFDTKKSDRRTAVYCWIASAALLLVGFVSLIYIFTPDSV